MSSHDLSLSRINNNVSIKPDTKSAAIESTESEGFIEELKELMGLSESKDAKKVADTEAEPEAVKLLAEAENELVEQDLESSVQDKMGEGLEFLSRLEQANGTLTTKEKIAELSSDETATQPEDSLLLQAQMSLNSASMSKDGQKITDKDLDASQQIQWGKQGQTSDSEMSAQNKGDALGNKESTKELLTSTALIAKAETESGKLVEAQKGKIDLSALGMTAVHNGESINLTESKTADSFAQQLSAASGTTATQQTAATAKAESAAALPLNLRQENVSDEVAERINMMMAKNLKHVDIRLDPPEMGRMHIRLNMGTDSAGVQFNVSNQQARDAIEQSLPRLREMFAQQGIQLADTSVQQQNSGESSQYAYQKQESTHQGKDSGFDEVFLEEQEISVNIAKPEDGISFYA